MSGPPLICNPVGWQGSVVLSVDLQGTKLWILPRFTVSTLMPSYMHVCLFYLFL